MQIPASFSPVTLPVKTVQHVSPAPERHWVGDGFPVHAMFGYGLGAAARSPFLLLDYAAPWTFAPNTGHRRGVGTHPHRGFETVTIVYEGQVEHRDSTGAGGIIGPGDVQWMTAGRGLVHEEFHSPAFSQQGGAFHMVQLWVNLPRKDKNVAPAYQAVLDAEIPAPFLRDEQGQIVGQVRVIAGAWQDQQGPAYTHTPMHVWDIALQAGAHVHLPQPEGWTCLLLVQQGKVRLQGTVFSGSPQLVTLSHAGQDVVVENLESTPARLLLLAGLPIDEPMVGYGPFVMNTEAEIRQAYADFHSGGFGEIPSDRT